MAKEFEQLITFIIGPEKINFRVHAAVLARQSSRLNKLIYGPTGKGAPGTIILKDVSGSTFVRFCQFAYFGDYEKPEPIETVKTTNIDGIMPQERNRRDDRRRYGEYDARYEEPTPSPSRCWAPKRKKHMPVEREQKPNTRRVLLERFRSRTYRATSNGRPFRAGPELPRHKSEKEDIPSILLEYGYLYAFSDRWNLPAMQTLTLSKLHQKLSRFNMSSASVDEVVALIRYTYDHKNTLDLVELDRLRELVASFAACQDDVLLRAPKFEELVKEGGLFAEAFHKMMRRRCIDPAKDMTENRNAHSDDDKNGKRYQVTAEDWNDY